MTTQDTTSKERDKEHAKGHLTMKTPPVVSQQDWEAARQQLLVKEKAFTRSRDARRSREEEAKGCACSWPHRLNPEFSALMGHGARMTA